MPRRCAHRAHTRCEAQPAGFRPAAWLPGKETACLVEELLALGEQEEQVATAEELDPLVRDFYASEVNLFNLAGRSVHLSG